MNAKILSPRFCSEILDSLITMKLFEPRYINYLNDMLIKQIRDFKDQDCIMFLKDYLQLHQLYKDKQIKNLSFNIRDSLELIVTKLNSFKEKLTMSNKNYLKSIYSESQFRSRIIEDILTTI